MKRMAILAVCVPMAGCMLPGNYLNPKSEPGLTADVRVLGQKVSIKDDANTDVEIGKLRFKKNGLEAEVEGFKRTQNVSDVRKADAEQMAQVNRTHEIQVEFGRAMGDAFAQGAGAVAGVVTAVAPNGIRGANETRAQELNWNTAMLVGAGLVVAWMFRGGRR